MAALWTRINTLLLLLLVLMAGATIAILATRAESGPLDPPGTPGPSLPQVEPRQPIPPVGWNGTFPIQIDQPGSYFLTRNLIPSEVSAVTIDSQHVTLDLNGFLVRRSGLNFADGIVVTAAADRGVEIRNGVLYNWATAINASAATGVRISNVRVSNSPVGISVAAGGAIEDCTVTNSGGRGIVVTGSSVRRCTVTGNAITGIQANGNSLIEDNLVFGNGTATGHLDSSNILVTGLYNYVRDNVVLTADGGPQTFRINGSNNHFLRNYYVCSTQGPIGANFFPAAVDLVDTNYC